MARSARIATIRFLMLLTLFIAFTLTASAGPRTIGITLPALVALVWWFDGQRCRSLYTHGHAGPPRR